MRKGTRMKARTFLFCFILSSLLIINSGSSPAQWVNSGQLNNLGNPTISVVDSNVVWVCGGTSSPVVYRTVNGGLNWTQMPVNGLPYFLFGIAAKDSLTAFVCDIGGNNNGGNAGFYKTTNAGLNWVLIDSTGGQEGYFNGIEFSKSNPMIGIAQSDPTEAKGDPYIVFKTTDGGNNWIKTLPPGIPNAISIYYSVFVIDEQFYGFNSLTLNPNTINSYITSNGGANWYQGNNSTPLSSNGNDLVFSDNKRTGIMLSDGISPSIKRTTDGGQTWVNINTNSSISGFVGADWISGTNTVFIICANNTNSQNILRSDDGGITWNSQNSSGVNNLIEMDHIRYNNVIVSYCVSQSGLIVKSRQDVTQVGISQISNSIPDKISLSQNYPNPFNPSTKIKFSIAQNVNSNTPLVKLSIFNSLGETVQQLVNEKLSAGSYEADFNGSGLSSGIYFYKLSVDNVTETRSMILLK